MPPPSRGVTSSDAPIDAARAFMFARPCDVGATLVSGMPTPSSATSKLVKEIALLGGDISPFTTPAVAQALINRSKEKT